MRQNSTQGEETNSSTIAGKRTEAGQTPSRENGWMGPVCESPTESSKSPPTSAAVASRLATIPYCHSTLDQNYSARRLKVRIFNEAKRNPRRR